MSSVPSAASPEREGGADRQTFAEVVQADADRDEQGQHPARVWRTAGPGASVPEPAAERLERQIRRRRAGHEQRQALIRAGSVPAASSPSCAASTKEEREQADREREQCVETGPAQVA